MSTRVRRRPHGPPQTVRTRGVASSSKKHDVGKLLWHYTRDFNGLKGILDGELWASNVMYLNDSEEFRYGVRKALASVRQELDISGNRHLKEAWLLISALILKNYQYSGFDVFSISFSTEEDDLSQWRAYGGSGPSFSIGFDRKKLELQAAMYLFDLHEIKYDRLSIRKDARQALKKDVAELNRAAQSVDSSVSPQEFAEERIWNLAVSLAQAAPRYKHPKFRGEREWRLVRHTSTTDRPRMRIQYRLGGSLVVPYVGMPLHALPSGRAVYKTHKGIDSPVAAITIGPSPHPNELVDVVNNMVSRIGLGFVKVRKSTIPFRNW